MRESRICFESSGNRGRGNSNGARGGISGGGVLCIMAARQGLYSVKRANHLGSTARRVDQNWTRCVDATIDRDFR
jgi:hypothetical protein